MSASSNPVYLRPTSLDDALGFLAAHPARMLAGGTDLFPAAVDRLLPETVLDISAIAGLRGITQEPDHIRIGAATTWTDLIAADLPPVFAALKAASREIGSVQIQNRGTIGGNLCNASPAADGVPPLLCLDAEVEIASAHGKRLLPLASFLTGYRRTDLQSGELVSAVLIPRRLGAAGSAFQKLGARRYLVISIVMVAATLLRGPDGRFSEAFVAVGAASETARRLPMLEQALKTLSPDRRPSSVLRHEHIAPLSPIDDGRATANYRRDAAYALIGTVLDQAAGFGTDHA